MTIARRAKAERPLEQDLARRRGKQVRTSHHLGHALKFIVHDNRQVIGERAISPLDDEITGVTPAVLPHRSLKQVPEFDDGMVQVDPEAQRVGLIASSRGIAAGSGIDRFRRGFGELGSRNRGTAAAAGIAVPARLEGLQGRDIGVDSISLEMDIAIPLETKGLERRLELSSQARNTAVAIKVVDTEQPAPPATTHIQIAAGSGQQ